METVIHKMQLSLTSKNFSSKITNDDDDDDGKQPFIHFSSFCPHSQVRYILFLLYPCEDEKLELQQANFPLLTTCETTWKEGSPPPTPCDSLAWVLNTVKLSYGK